MILNVYYDFLESAKIMHYSEQVTTSEELLRYDIPLSQILDESNYRIYQELCSSIDTEHHHIEKLNMISNRIDSLLQHSFFADENILL
jgi:hypothetical protein